MNEEYLARSVDVPLSKFVKPSYNPVSISFYIIRLILYYGDLILTLYGKGVTPTTPFRGNIVLT